MMHIFRARSQIVGSVFAVSLTVLAACGSSTGSTATGHGDGGGDGAGGGKIEGGHKGDSGGQHMLHGSDGGGGQLCKRLTCQALGVDCGPQGDGCGGMLDCGSCTAPATCGGGGAASKCGGTGGCVPTTCAAKGMNCGPASDGCGGLLQCGSCSGGQECGGAPGKPGVCATPIPPPDAGNPCVPKTCTELHIGCGPAGDGCGGSLSCGSCSSGDTCGGGGTASQCGKAMPCVPTTCSKLGAKCGIQADGCGGSLNCGIGDGGGCVAGQTCGGGGTPNQCGAPPMCVPETCAQLGVGCGPSGDGCGGTIAGGCGTCMGTQTCGGGGTPSQCGTATPPMCTPKTCAQLGVGCGPSGDGCGGTIAGGCGGCDGGTCGGGGTPSQCGGAPACVPKTCAQLGFNCGLASDTCGGILNCGGGGGLLDGGVDAALTDAGPGCTSPQVCGGGGQPNVCGPVVACTGYCLDQPPCDGGATTTLTGTVWAPNGTDPIYDAIVYVPNGTVEPIPPPLSCGCQPVSGDPLVQATTGVDGTFMLPNVPAGVAFPLVIQLGPWRRQVTVGPIAACATVDSSTFGACNAASAASATSTTGCLTSFPTVHAQGDIPLIALITGKVDTLECVFRKIGLQDSEFGDPGPAGDPTANPNRVQLFLGDTDPGASYDGTTPSEDNLWSTTAAIDAYDLVLFSCQGAPVYRDNGAGVMAGPPPSTAQSNVINYANLGGRIFATHYNYTWFYDDAPFSTTANWAVDPNKNNSFQDDPGTGLINMGFARGLALAQWLENIYPADTPGQIAVNTLRDDFGGGVVPPSLLWMTVDDPRRGTVPLEYTFDTPVATPAPQQCGRVEFEDYHVENANNAGGQTFPNECDNNPMTPQEKLLEFQIFDLSSCLSPPASCTPLTCATAGPGGTALNCGLQSDGCGNLLNCGTCTPPATCGGGGTPGVCGTVCVPLTCANAGPGGTAINCGTASDGCGGITANCGSCATGQTCGGGGQANMCSPPGSCTPLTCANAGPGGTALNCGTPADGCGGTLPSCGTCTPPETCGGGGSPNVCGGAGCTPATCASQGFNCGPAGDGCGNELQCGTCTPPQTCGGGGKASVCGANGCTATTCSALGFNCGPAGDGCGGELQCGTCPVGQACGAGGQPGVCAPLDAGSCIPETCSQQKLACGPAGDGCGGETQCGSCPTGQTCGGGGTPGQCGNTGCQPKTCAQQNLSCGPAGDGCGGELQCGTCTPPNTCGGDGTRGQCGTPAGPA